MPGRVPPLDRVAQGIQVGVDPDLFRWHRVGAVEAVFRGVGAVTAAEQVAARGLLAKLAVECQQAVHAVVVLAFAIGGVAGGAGAFGVHLGDDAAGIVGQQQQRVGGGVRALHRQGMGVTQQVLGQQAAFPRGLQPMVLVAPLHLAGPVTVHAGQQLVMAVVQVMHPFTAVFLAHTLQAASQVVLQRAPLLVVEPVAARVVGEGLCGRVVFEQGVGHLGQLEAVIACIAELRSVLAAIAHCA